MKQKNLKYFSKIKILQIMKTFYAFSYKKAIAFMIFMLAFTTCLKAQTPQYYNYQGVGTSSNIFPFAVVAGKQVQWLFLAGDFNMPAPAPSGNITKIYLYMTGASTNTLTNLTVKMGQSTITLLPTGAIYTGQLDTVYFRASVQLTSTVNGWMSITLDTPYLYDNTKSLILDISQCGATSTTMTLRQNVLAIPRRTYVNAASCVFTYGGQDGSVVNCGVDISPPTVVCNYSWATQVSGTPNLLQTVWAVNGSVVWAGGAAATVRRTTDGGVTWGNGNTNPGIITGDIYNICAFDANNAWCTTSPGATFIYRTTNGGANWTQVFTQAGGFIDAIIFKDANNGFAYGDPVSARWSLWKSTNAGATWDSAGMYLAQVASEAGWNNAMSLIGNNVWFGTNSTKVYHSTNYGATGSWTAGVTTGNINTYAVWFTSATNGMCTGALDQISTNGGSTWTNGGTVGGTGNMTAVGGIGSNYWLTRGNNIYGSTNFGSTWTGAGYTGTTALWGINITTATNGCLTGWAVGATGTIVKLTGIPVGISNNHNEIPLVYSLSQNYPNPFNPSTSISFALPTAGNVELKVYDVLGREAASILNEFRPAGSYRVEFNASNLASGVYYYTIRSDNFSDTKKMVLIK
jgi:hypothetical protein